ncbi:MAG TPA: L-2-hydroxyglutarate oxidase [Solirubrobacteraceae bacterium]|nr:L-2-hydroxyglutarate oxidase [Solirubrobacteraceae bacterium]
MPGPPERADLTVVGGGVIGLAVGRELATRHPGLRVCVLERESRLAAHQTGHNSGVIHAGVYYAPGSLKARLCADGAGELYAFCAAHEIPHERCGKLILATAPAELGRLDQLELRARRSGVPGLRRLGPDDVRELEPHAAALAGLHSPNTGIVDFASVAEALADDLRQAGGRVETGCGVLGVTSHGRGLRLRHARGTLETRAAVFCAGAWADRLAAISGADPDPRIVPFRGAYLALRAPRRTLVRSLIYPVPDPRLPFLGVHLTRTIGGGVLIGPSALVVGARDAYDVRRVRATDLADTLSWPGTWRMVRRHWRAAIGELAHAALPVTLVRAAARLIPELDPADVEPSFAGIRAQAVGRDGRLVDDFVFSRTDRAIHVRNAPSPGASAALAIARHVADRVDRELV